MDELVNRAKKIKLAIFDVDGVLTDGRLYLANSGEESKAFYVRDGLGMKMLMATGIEIGIITGKTSTLVQDRMQHLGIRHVYQGQGNKLPAFQALCEKLSLQADEVAYVGDDVIDIPILKYAGLSVAVADAHDAILPYTHWQTKQVGGRGAVREVCDLIMHAQGTLSKQLAVYTEA